MERHDFTDATTGSALVDLTPDAPKYPAEMAEMMTEAMRQSDPEALRSVGLPDAEKAIAACSARYDERIALYRRGIRQWDTKVAVTMVVRDRKMTAGGVPQRTGGRWEGTPAKRETIATQNGYAGDTADPGKSGSLRILLSAGRSGADRHIAPDGGRGGTAFRGRGLPHTCDPSVDLHRSERLVYIHEDVLFVVPVDVDGHLL